MKCPINIRKISMNHKKVNIRKDRHKHDVINHVMSLLSWWTLGQGFEDLVVRHRRDRILTEVRSEGRATTEYKDETEIESGTIRRINTIGPWNN